MKKKRKYTGEVLKGIRLPHVRDMAKARKGGRKTGREDANQLAARIVRESTR